MIRKNLINCKLFFQKCFTQEHYNSCMKEFRPGRESCPACGARGMCKAFASYERGVMDIADGKPVFRRVRIIRVRCSSCGHTHAIMPDCLVPYRQYSLRFILYILRIYFTHALTISRIYDAYGITHTVLYDWVSVFGRHARVWLGMMESSLTPARDFLHRLAGMEPFSAFTSAFYHLSLLSFLQSHANPANCRHRPPGFPGSGPPATQDVHIHRTAGHL